MGGSRAADGFFLVSELRSARRRSHYPPALLQAYEEANAAIQGALQQPIKYARPSRAHWVIFARPYHA